MLNFIKEQMDIISVPYEFGEWSSDVKYPYFVGEYEEESPTTEDGSEQFTLILTGFNRGTFSVLETVKEKIKKHFPIHGLRGRTKDGGAIAVFFDGAFPVPSGEAGLKKIQINLKIKTWKGDM